MSFCNLKTFPKIVPAVGVATAVALLACLPVYAEKDFQSKSNDIKALEEKGKEYSNHRQWGKAQVVYGRILQKLEKQWGTDDPRLIKPLNDLVRVTCVDGKCADTVPYLNTLLKIRVKKFGPWNADVATTYALIAEANEKMQRYPEAIKNFRQAIKIRDHLFGKTAGMSVRTRLNVIRVALKNKDKTTARAMQLECQTLLSAQRNPEPELEKLLSYYARKI